MKKGILILSLLLSACQSSTPAASSGPAKEPTETSTSLPAILFLMDGKTLQAVASKTALGLMDEGSKNIEKQLENLDLELSIFCDSANQICHLQRKSL